MLKKLKDELISDSTDIWIAICSTKHPGFWGFLVGYSSVATAIYTVLCVVIIGLSFKIRKENGAQ